MTEEKRTDVLLVSLVVAVLAHAALMVTMKSQVMSRVAEGLEAEIDPAPITIEDEEAPIPVRVDSVTDVEATRAAPKADAGIDESSRPAMGESLAVSSMLPSAPAPQAPKMPTPVLEAAPYLSEKIHFEGKAEFSTAVVPTAAEVSRIGEAPSLESAKPDPVEIPDFTAPVVLPPMIESAQIVDEEPAKIVEEAKSKAKGETETFKPREVVQQTVDEQLVAAEKQAVRELLNVTDAEDLAKFATVGSASARAGEWSYFKFTIDPSKDLKTVPKDVVVLLDASGSIGNDRLTSCRVAAKSILRSATNTGDRFNLVAFRDKYSYAFKNWQPCDKASFDKADKWFGNLAAHGRTDVFGTISSVMTLPRDPKRPLIALVVTDGDANVGVSETAQILSKFTALNDGLISVYMYGVKSSANRQLIDVLTHGNRGEGYIFDGSRWKAGSKLEDLSVRFRDPVLSDLRVVFAANSPAEAYPRLLRNLCRGQKVELYGRVPAGTNEVKFSLRGLSGADSYEGFYTVKLSDSTFDASLPDAWNAEKSLDRLVH